MCILLNDEGSDALKDKELFHCTVRILASLKEENAGIIPEHHMQSDAAAKPQNLHSLFHDYFLSGSIDDLLNVSSELTERVAKPTLRAIITE